MSSINWNLKHANYSYSMFFGIAWETISDVGGPLSILFKEQIGVNFNFF